jgi:4-hydroxy-tetrahydrodipicolinate synthase
MNLEGGLWVALATPFGLDGTLDLAALRRLVAHVRQGGAEVLVALGSTGEAAALTNEERDTVLGAVLDAAGDTPVVAGTGASSTAQAAEQTARAAELGAAGALVVVPPYVKPTQAGIVAHFAAVAARAPDLPLIAYNVPSRTGTNLLPGTVAQLFELDAVVGLKESSGDLGQIGTVAAALPAGKLLLAGDDPLALSTLALGAHGVVSVAGNLVPAPVHELVTLARDGAFAAARIVHERLLPLFAALSTEPNPIPVKAGLRLLGLGDDVPRLPLLPAAPTTVERLRLALDTCSLVTVR